MRGSNDTFLLGQKIDSFAMVRGYEDLVRKEVEKFPPNQVLSTPEDDLIRYMVDKFSLDVPGIDAATTYISGQGETQIDVSRRFDYDYQGTVTGQQIVIAIPFRGDPDLFHVRASRFTMNPPRISLGDGVVYLRFADINLDPVKVRAEIDRQTSSISEHLCWLKNDLDQWNARLPQYARDALMQRKKRLTTQMNTVEAIGLPIKRRPDEALTYAAPEVRRKIQVNLPPVPKTAFKPEPALDAAEFEHILAVIGKVALVFERSPSTFSKMGEEALRDNILVHLNGHYESATGETFNSSGKTDILIRSGERNVFIAECKFWHGSKGYGQAIDQLLSYITWRDTKAAVIIFNKNKELSSVLSAIQEATEKHQNWKKTIAAVSETSFRYVFRQNTDEARELHLAVLVFDVPTQQ